MLIAAIKALRPRQWVKNGIVFAALVFSQEFRDLNQVLLTVAAAALLCAASSSGYLFNDLRDVENDRLHPDKKHRPIASGALPMWAAWSMMAILLVGSIAGAWFLRPLFALTVTGYLVMTISYSLWVKNLVILDAMFIAGLFIVRAVAGAAAIDVPISPWFLITMMFGALFLGFSKRRAELRLLEEDAAKHRKILAEFARRLLVLLSAGAGATAILSYAMYTFEAAPTPALMVTIPFVVYGIFRYFYLIHHRAEGGAPDVTLFRDPGIWVTVLLFVITVVVVLLFFLDVETGF